MKKALMIRGEFSREVELEPMFGRPGEYVVVPFLVAKSSLEEIGFRFWVNRGDNVKRSANSDRAGSNRRIDELNKEAGRERFEKYPMIELKEVA